ncbi:hypothetical protein D3C75_1044080 [compost metagenome]
MALFWKLEVDQLELVKAACSFHHAVDCTSKIRVTFGFNQQKASAFFDLLLDDAQNQLGFAGTRRGQQRNVACHDVVGQHEGDHSRVSLNQRSAAVVGARNTF